MGSVKKIYNVFSTQKSLDGDPVALLCTTSGEFNRYIA